MRASKDLTERQIEWGTTMRGRDVDGIELAHADTHVHVAAGAPLDRAVREQTEDETMRLGATRSHGAGARDVRRVPLLRGYE